MFELVPFTAGPMLIFGNVLATSLGLPVPALPTLMVVAASMAAASPLQWPTLALCLIASMLATVIGDTVWFFLGRRFGNRTLRALCWLSLSRDTCVRQTEGVFGRFGIKVLAVAKFVPGLSMIAVPLAGAMRVRTSTFIGYDLLGACLWGASGLAVGTIFSHHINLVLAIVVRTGGRAAMLVLLALAIYVGYRWWRRRSLLRLLETARIDVEALYELMSGQPAPLLFDVRSHETRFLEPVILPGAEVVELNGALRDMATLDRHQPMVVYCGCPNEVSAARYAQRLRREGFDSVHVLRGGIEAWRAAGKLLAPVPNAELARAVTGSDAHLRSSPASS